MKPARRLAWKLLAGVVGVLLVFAGSLWAWVKSAESRKWAAMERRVAELSAESAAWGGERRPLRGEAVPGNAWEHYRSALLLASSGAQPWDFRKAVGNLEELLAKEHPSAEELEAAVAPMRPALQALRKGARVATAVLPDRDDLIDEAPGYLATLAACEARAARMGGRPADAVDLLLEVARFGLDLHHAGWEVPWMNVYDPILAELRFLARGGELSPAGLADLGRTLERFEQAIPASERAMKRGMRNLGADLLQTRDAVEALSRFQGDSLWRFVFSNRHLCADAFHVFDRWTADFAACDALSYPEARARLSELQKEAESSRNGVVRWIGSFAFDDHRPTRRSVRARLRLLRMACGAEVLKDPFGGKLKRAEGKLWSFGPDGVDDGGKGGWTDGPDIVLELKRP